MTLVFTCYRRYKITRGPLSGSVKYTGVRKFSDFRPISRKRYQLGSWLLWIANRKSHVVPRRVVFVGGSRGTSPSLDLGEWKGGGEGKGKEKGGGDHLPYFPPPTGLCLKYHPGPSIRVCSNDLEWP